MSNPVTMPMGDDYKPQGGDRNTPVPDPTRLTTQLVDRAMAAFREVMETRLQGMDEATKIVAADIIRTSEYLEAQRAHLREDVDRQLSSQREYLIERINRISDIASEKFVGVDTRFAERDERTAQAAQESRISLDTALAAAKEAVSEQNKANTLAIGKSEAATQKQMDSNFAQVSTSINALEDKIADVKLVLARAPGEAAQTVKADTRLDKGQTYVVMSLIIAVIGIAIGLVVGLR